MEIIDRFGRIVNLLEKIQMAAGILFIALIGVIIPLQVFCRYVLNAPLKWPEDVGLGLMVWVAFLGTAVLYKRGEHVMVEVFSNHFPEKVSTGVALTIDLMIGFLTVLIIISSFELNKMQMMTTQIGTGMPRGYFHALPLLLNMCILFIYNLHAVLRKMISIVYP